ncbi:MAG: SH3 domain-containing protein [Actinomycetota bacterium]|nr:SH3 domain-containing protein [Actinomycetota bacterium]
MSKLFAGDGTNVINEPVAPASELTPPSIPPELPSVWAAGDTLALVDSYYQALNDGDLGAAHAVGPWTFDEERSAILAYDARYEWTCSMVADMEVTCSERVWDAFHGPAGLIHEATATYRIEQGKLVGGESGVFPSVNGPEGEFLTYLQEFDEWLWEDHPDVDWLWLTEHEGVPNLYMNLETPRAAPIKELVLEFIEISDAYPAPIGATPQSQLGPPIPFDPPDVYPPEGLDLRVVGIAHDGGLNLRESPGLSPVVAVLASTDEVSATGNGHEASGSMWWEVDAGGTIGWVNAKYLASWASARLDLTPYILSEFRAYPEAASMEDLGHLIAESLVSDEYPWRSVVITPTTTIFNTFIALDVVADDPMGLRIAMNEPAGQTGWRLTVNGESVDGGYRLTRVEGQPLLNACACWAL